MPGTKDNSQSPPVSLLPTTVIGSYAYPSWLWTALEEMRQGKYGESDIAETLGDRSAGDWHGMKQPSIHAETSVWCFRSSLKNSPTVLAVMPAKGLPRT